MTLQKQLETALEQLRKTQEENKIIRAYIHDLSNPLQILGMSIEVLNEQCSEKQKPTVERIQRSTERLMEIMKEIRKLQYPHESFKKAEEIT